MEKKKKKKEKKKKKKKKRRMAGEDKNVKVTPNMYGCIFVINAGEDENMGNLKSFTKGSLSFFNLVQQPFSSNHQE